PAAPLRTDAVADREPLEVVPDQAAPSAPAQAARPTPKKAAKQPAKAAKAAKKPASRKPAKAWVEPSGEVCPTSHPVKAKLTSKIFHLPGMLNYERTRPDRCYRDADAAEGDGLRAAKR
ncbi:MAG: sunset domain-containing protein, partial [Acidimicrobiales bacterium]